MHTPKYNLHDYLIRIKPNIMTLQTHFKNASVNQHFPSLQPYLSPFHQVKFEEKELTKIRDIKPYACR